MLTMEPGPDIAPYHDRQIAILNREDWKAWLDPSISATSILKSLPADSLSVEQAGISRGGNLSEHVASLQCPCIRPDEPFIPRARRRRSEPSRCLEFLMRLGGPVSRPWRRNQRVIRERSLRLQRLGGLRRHSDIDLLPGSSGSQAWF